LEAVAVASSSHVLNWNNTAQYENSRKVLVTPELYKQTTMCAGLLQNAVQLLRVVRLFQFIKYISANKAFALILMTIQ
jgi:hypothetical protein